MVIPILFSQLPPSFCSNSAPICRGEAWANLGGDVRGGALGRDGGGVAGGVDGPVVCWRGIAGCGICTGGGVGTGSGSFTGSGSLPASGGVSGLGDSGDGAMGLGGEVGVRTG